MTKKIKYKKIHNENSDKLKNICEVCKKKDKTVLSNLILTGFKLCESCRISKTIFPI